MSAKFYICDHCGNLITTLHDAGVPMLCCGEKMRELIPNTVEASGEKHLPVVERCLCVPLRTNFTADSN